MITILKSAGDGAGDWHVALKSGGHAVDGQNNIDNGVTIDLSQMNGSSYDPESNLAKIQPGGKWKNVYADLLERGVMATGGRDGDVGVGGFLLGGGNTYYMGRRGFGCDSVSNYEVVLGNGSIVNANESANADLWKALRGGGSNFGVVTRYDLDALPAHNLSYGLQQVTMEHSDALLDGLSSFTDLSEEDATYDAMFLTYYTEFNDNPPAATAIKVNTANLANSSAFTSFNSIPSIVDTQVSLSLADAAESSQLESGVRSLGWAQLFKNDPKILRACVDLYEEYTKEMQLHFGVVNFSSRLISQPMPTYFADIGNRRGGNVIGFDRNTDNAILWVMGYFLKGDAADQAVAHNSLGRLAAATEQAARNNDGDLEFVYYNYANPSQDPLGSYGEENIQFMKDVAKKYDPEGFFQKRVPGGFKLERVH